MVVVFYLIVVCSLTTNEVGRSAAAAATRRLEQRMNLSQDAGEAASELLFVNFNQDAT